MILIILQSQIKDSGILREGLMKLMPELKNITWRLRRGMELFLKNKMNLKN